MSPGKFFKATSDVRQINLYSFDPSGQSRSDWASQAIRIDPFPGIRRVGKLYQHLSILRDQFARVAFNCTGRDGLHHSHIDVQLFEEPNQPRSESGLANTSVGCGDKHAWILQFFKSHD